MTLESQEDMCLLLYIQNGTGGIMPISVLLRSTMAHNHEQQLYKRFLTKNDQE
jgi:phage portal protein BeeE